MKSQLVIIIFLIAITQTLYAQTVTEWIIKGFDNLDNKNFDKAINDYTKAIAVEPGRSDAYYYRGQANEVLRRYTRAIADYSQTIALEPKSADAYYCRGMVKLKLKHYAGAVSDYDITISINSNYYNAYNGRSVAKIYLGNYIDAIADCEQAVAINPKRTVAYNTRGYAYYQLGKTKENYRKAIADYDTSVRLAAGDASYVPDFKYRYEAVAAMSTAEGN